MSASPFPTDFCPLCKTELKKVNAFGTGYTCTNVVVNESGEAIKYHYYVDIESGSRMPGSYQNVIIPPFHFFSHSDENATQIMKWSADKTPYDGSLLMELPRITDWSEPDKLINRIQALVVFS